LKDIIIWIIPFLLTLILVLAIVNIFPVFSLWLPSVYGLI
jgi:TRAP-type C4-dicarboxylate transport system permease large subunit